MADKRIRIILDSKNAEQNAKSLDKAMVGVGSSSDKAQFSVNKLAAAIASALAVDKILAYADAFTSVQNQIRRTTDSQEALSKTTLALLEISNQTRTGLQETTELYTSLALSTQALGYSQEQVFNITKTINNLFLESGKAASETAGAIRQLGQALQSGALRGDEFNSIAEGAPGILRAIQQETGKTAGQLREFAATGGITAELLTKSLENYAETAQKAADRTEITLGQSLIVAKNNATVFVGSVNAATGATESLAKGIVNLSNSLASQENISNFIQFFKQASETIDDTTGSLDAFSEELELVGNIGSEAFNLFGRSIRDIFPNIKTLIQIITVELVAGVDKAIGSIKTFAEIVSNPFDDEAIKKSIADYNTQLEGINANRQQSIADVIAERDAVIESSKAKAAAAAKENSFFGNKKAASSKSPAASVGASQADSAALKADLDLQLKLNKIFNETRLADDADYYAKKSAQQSRDEKNSLARLQAAYDKENASRSESLAKTLNDEKVTAQDRGALIAQSQKQGTLSAQIYEQEKTNILLQAAEERKAIAKEEAESLASGNREIDSAKQITQSLQAELDQRRQAARFYRDIEINENIGFFDKQRAIQANDESIRIAELEKRSQEDLSRQAEQIRQTLENEKLSNEAKLALKAEYDAQVLLSEQNIEAEKNRIRSEGVQARNELDKAEYDARVAAVGDLGNALISLGQGQSKKIFKIGQTLALAQAAVSLPAAVLESFKNGGGYPFGLVPAAAMLATGLKNIQQIRSAGAGLGGGGGGASPSASLGGGGGGSSIPTTSSQIEQTQQKRVYDLRGVKADDKISVSALKQLLEDDGAIVTLEEARADAQRRNVIGVTAR